MLKQPLLHVFHPQSEALCLYVLTLSQNQNIINNIYLTALLKNFRQRQYQQQHISYYFVEEF